MKKLMIAAAIAAMGAGAFAECQEVVDPTPCVFAYKFTLSGKGLSAKSVSTTVQGNGQCTEKGAICFAVPASYKVTGYLYGTSTYTPDDPDTCTDGGCGCNDFTDFEAYVISKGDKTIAKVDATIDQLDVIGTKQNKVQMLAKFADITLGGQGTVKKGKVTTVKGNFVGTDAAPLCVSCTSNYDELTCTDVPDCQETVAQVGALCKAELADCTASIVYGKWTLKANKAMAKKLTKDYQPQTLAKGYVVL